MDADLRALPTDWRLVRVGPDKAPMAGKDWFDVDNFSPDEAISSSRGKPPAWGLKCGPTSGIVVLDLDAKGWEESFKQETGHPITDLPLTIAWTSGKHGRSGRAFAVDMDWWPSLANRRAWNNNAGETCWELRGDRHQSVIIGVHPETGSYRWLEGSSPHEMPDPAPAPDWLLEAMVIEEVPQAAPIEITDADADRALAMLQCLPATDLSNYDDWLRVGMALYHTDPGLLTAWVEWCRAMPNFDEAECLKKWESFGKPYKGKPATIRSLHYLAKPHGYRESRKDRSGPPTAESTKAIETSTQSRGAIADAHQSVHAAPEAKQTLSDEELGYRELLDGVLNAIKADDQDREMILRAELKNRFRVSDEQIGSALLRRYSEAKIQRVKPAHGSVSLAEVEPLHYLMDGWILEGDLCLTYGPYGTGKTTLALWKAYSLAKGQNILDRSTPCQPGRSLFIATDSGAASLKKACLQLGIDPDTDPLLTPGHPDQMIWIWAYEPNQGHEAWVCDIHGIIKLEAAIVRYQINYVIIDSAKSVSSAAGWSYTSNESVKALLKHLRECVCTPTGACIDFLSHDGSEKGSHSGAKAWAEDPSMVCALTLEEAPEGQAAGVSVQFRKDRAASVDPRRKLSYVLADETLDLRPEVEVVGTCEDAILAVLWEAHQRGMESVRTGELMDQLWAKYRKPRKTVENTLGKITGTGRGPNPTPLIRPRRGSVAFSPKEIQRRVSTPNRGVGEMGGGKSRSTAAQGFTAPPFQTPTGETQTPTGETIGGADIQGPDFDLRGSPPVGDGPASESVRFAKGDVVELCDPWHNWSNGHTVISPPDAEGLVKVRSSTGSISHVRPRNLRHWRDHNLRRPQEAP